LVTPEKTLRDEEADFVALPLFDGEIGIAAGHSPMIGRLGFGEMRIVLADRTERYYVEAGFVEVINNVISVLTDRAARSEDLDLSVGMERLQAAIARPAKSAEEIGQRERLVAQARGEIQAARRAER
jgi:F-type H+-transporting ATPase subunit epsilon